MGVLIFRSGCTADFLFVVFENIALPRNKLKGLNPLFNSSFYLSYDIGLKTSKDDEDKVFNLSIHVRVHVVNSYEKYRRLSVNGRWAL